MPEPKVNKQRPTTDVWKNLQLDREISKAALTKKNLVAQRLAEIEPLLASYTEKASFPTFMIKEFQTLGFKEIWTPLQYGGTGFSELEKCAIAWEICKVDLSLTTFLGVQGLGIATIDACGDVT